MPLTDAKVRNAKPSSKPYKLYDERGLFLLVMPEGGRLWRFRFRFEGKEKLLALGAYDDVSLKDTRERRDAACKQVAAGIDPCAQRKAHKTARVERAANSFEVIYRIFAGPIIPGADYLIVDDFIGMGGTVANLRGYVEQQGGRVLAATALTGKSYSASLKPREETLRDLRGKHGPELEHWWQAAFGHDFSLPTQSEARYLYKSRDVDTIRDRLLAARFV